MEGGADGEEEKKGAERKQQRGQCSKRESERRKEGRGRQGEKEETEDVAARERKGEKGGGSEVEGTVGGRVQVWATERPQQREGEKRRRKESSE